MSEQTTIIKPFNLTITKLELEQILKLFNTIVEDIQIKLDNEGLYIVTMDPQHVALLEIALPDSAFEKYEVNDDIIFNVDIEKTLKIVNQFDKNDNIRMTIGTDNKNKQVLKLECRELSYTVNLLDSISQSTPIPRLPYDCKATLYGDSIKKYLTKLNVTSKYVTLETNDQSFALSNSGDNGTCKIILEKGHLDLVNLSCRNNSKCTYSTEYIIPYFKAMLSNFTHDIEYSTQKPLRINSNLFYVGRVNYYIAPRVES